MSTKTISIIDEAYNLLKKEKKGNESFSNVIIRTFSKNNNQSELLNYVGFLSKEEGEELENNVYERRKTWRRKF